MSLRVAQNQFSTITEKQQVRGRQQHQENIDNFCKIVARIYELMLNEETDKKTIAAESEWNNANLE